MKSYVVSLELTNGLKNYSDLTKVLKSFRAKSVINESVWVLMTEQSAIELRDHLKQFLQSQDRIFILKSGVVAAWLNPACGHDWLRENL
jgi:predicted transcriptional regulator